MSLFTVYILPCYPFSLFKYFCW